MLKLAGIESSLIKVLKYIIDMHFSTGCAFTVEDIFMNFKYKKLKLTVPECRKITGDSHRKDVVCRVFRYCFYLVVVDIIEHNATFHFPLTAGKKCNMHM